MPDAINIKCAQEVNPLPTTTRPMSLNEAAEANLRTGVLLLCKEALVTAIQDRRLERGHLRVLAAVVSFMSSKTGKAWPGRGAVAESVGMSVRAVSNTLLELRKFGYLIADREAVEEANFKRLTCYTFGNIDHDTIRREITAFVHRVRAARDPEELRKVTAHGDVQSHRPRGLSPPTVTSEVTAHGDLAAEVTAHGAGKSPPTVDSNLYKELVDRHTQESPYNSVVGKSLGHGVVETSDMLTHKHFTISLAAARMNVGLNPALGDIDIDMACRAAALQWASAIEAGQRPSLVVPANVIGAIIGGVRRGLYGEHEHKVRMGRIAGKSAAKPTRW